MAFVQCFFTWFVEIVNTLPMQAEEMSEITCFYRNFVYQELKFLWI